MKKIAYTLFSVLTLCCFCSNMSSAQRHIGHGFCWKIGYSQFIALSDFSRYLKGGYGIQVELDILYGRFEFCASSNGSFSKVKNDLTINDNIVNVNEEVGVDMVGFSVSYAVLYTDYLKIGPLAGTIWNSLHKDKDDKIRPKYMFTGTVGFQIEYNYVVTSLGGLTGGFCVPLYLKYNYCFPQKFANEINSGMHFITIGLGIIYLKGDDK